MKPIFASLFNKKDEEAQTRLKRTMTANEFINVKDIQEDVVYTKDNHLFVYLKIQPISLELLSQREQRIKGRQFSTEFSAIKRMYKLFSISRPVDVTFMLDNLRRMQMETTDRKRREVLTNKIREVNQFALSGEILEHQFYMILWHENKKDGERELLKQVNEIIARFKACEMEVSICKKGECIKLLNLFSNPNYAHLEDEDIDEHIPFSL